MGEKNSGTKILAVSNELTVLTELNGILGKIFSFADIIKETDPLMACKYSFNNDVDFAFASEEMKRMSGSDLLRFIKKEHPDVKTYLLFNRERRPEETFCDDFDGAIGYPFTEEELMKALGNDLNAPDLRGGATAAEKAL